MSNCKCGRHYTDQWHRWVVLRRSSDANGSSKLYCLDCRGEWSSRAKYIILLPDHVKRIRSGMTDQDILDRILDGSLEVVIHTAKVFSNGKELKQTSKTHRDGPQRGTYRFVEVAKDKLKKKIAVHRLVWMAAHKTTIPEGHDIDHRVSQDDDSIDNLRLLKSEVNRSLGSAKRFSSQPQGDDSPVAETQDDF